MFSSYPCDNNFFSSEYFLRENNVIFIKCAAWEVIYDKQETNSKVINNANQYKHKLIIKGSIL